MKLPLICLLLTITASGLAAWQLEPNCGIKGPVKSDFSRIIGGIETAPHEFPWQVAFLGGGGCGASIIGKQWLVTAAHCMFARDPSTGLVLYRMPDYKLQTYFAAHHFNFDAVPHSSDASTFSVPVIKSFVHESYHPNGFTHEPVDFNNDIALLKLSTQLSLDNRMVGAICLPETEPYIDDLVGTESTAIGWGQTDDADDHSDSLVLLKTNLTIVKQSKCVEEYDTIPWVWDQKVHHGAIKDQMICATKMETGTCHGDSGGPLATFNEKTSRWQLTGVVSFGDGQCANPQHPDVYARVAAFLPWIKKIIETNSD